MPYQPYVTVEVDTGTWVTVSNVQDINVSSGRTKISDEWRPGTGTITGRRNDLLPSGIEIGTELRIRVGAQGGTTSVISFRVSDVNLNYGIIASLDTWQITVEDAFAYLGRNTINVSWASGTTTAAAFQAICTESNLTGSVVVASSSAVSAQTITNGNAQDLMQTVLNTEQGAVYADGTTLRFYGRNWQSTVPNLNFTDTGAGVDPIRYDQVVFRSMADNYADYVIVYPRGGSGVVSGDGIFSYNLDSYSLNSGEALNLAQYVKGAYSVQNSTPNTVSLTLNEQSNMAFLDGIASPANVRLTLRGTVYNSIVLGYSISGDPSSLRFTFNLASSDFFSFLTLDNTIYGTLDYNKLGY